MAIKQPQNIFSEFPGDKKNPKGRVKYLLQLLSEIVTKGIGKFASKEAKKVNYFTLGDTTYNRFYSNRISYFT